MNVASALPVGDVTHVLLRHHHPIGMYRVVAVHHDLPRQHGRRVTERDVAAPIHESVVPVPDLEVAQRGAVGRGGGHELEWVHVLVIRVRVLEAHAPLDDGAQVSRVEVAVVPRVLPPPDSGIAAVLAVEGGVTRAPWRGLRGRQVPQVIRPAGGRPRRQIPVRGGGVGIVPCRNDDDVEDRSPNRDVRSGTDLAAAHHDVRAPPRRHGEAPDGAGVVREVHLVLR